MNRFTEGVNPISNASEIRLKGLPLSAGVGLGRPCFYRETALVPVTRTCRENGNEHRRLTAAIGNLAGQLQNYATAAHNAFHREISDIFLAHRMILEDADLQQTLFNALGEDTAAAEDALVNQFDIYSAQLRQHDDGYFTDRAEDFEHLKYELLRILRGSAAHLYCKEAAGCTIGQCRLGNEHILVAPRLTASMAVQIGPRTKGVVVESGGWNSHAAIIARALGLPVVSQIPRTENTIPVDSEVMVDGDTGELIIHPGADTLAQYRKKLVQQSQAVGCTSQAVSVLQVFADIDGVADLDEAIKAGAEGIGLYRTEIEVLRGGRILSEDEQAALYTQVVTSMRGEPVYIRLLDLGSDKSPPQLGFPREENPALGRRGARLLLDRPEFLRSQARALARASMHGPIHIIYPMIISLEQFLELRTLLQTMVTVISTGTLYHGVMFEVPSACLQCEDILDLADFGRIGTNDLTQYLFAVDRQDDYNGQAALFDQPALWTLINNIAQVARRKHKPLSLCGELANDPGYTGRIMSCRIQMVSIRPRQIAAIRAAASACSRTNNHAGNHNAPAIHGKIQSFLI